MDDFSIKTKNGIVIVSNVGTLYATVDFKTAIAMLRISGTYKKSEDTISGISESYWNRRISGDKFFSEFDDRPYGPFIRSIKEDGAAIYIGDEIFDVIFRPIGRIVQLDRAPVS